MTTLVTGGGGFLGRAIVERLLDRGDCVRVFARGDYPWVAERGGELVRGDLKDRSAVNAACGGVGVVHHVAAVPGVWGPREFYFDNNVLGTRNLLEASRDAGVQKFVFTSSPSVVFDGSDHVEADESLPYPEKYLCHYPETKALAERDVLAANGAGGLATTALRPHLIFGPRDPHLIPRVIARAKAGRLRRVGDGTNVVSVSYVENVAQAHLQAADRLMPGAPHAGKAYFINEPEPVVLWEWVDELLTTAGLAPRRRARSVAAAEPLGAVLEGVCGVLPGRPEPPMTRFVALQLGKSHSYSVAAAGRDFGYEPVVPFDEAMRRLKPWLQAWGAGRDEP
ncbi:MAG: NAD-dependent epimerase/dehydratase family protein [Planctomycetota bacterium]